MFDGGGVGGRCVGNHEVHDWGCVRMCACAGACLCMCLCKSVSMCIYICVCMCMRMCGY